MSNLFEGLLRLLLLVGYIWGIGFMPDIRRLFAYHGAEHKTINAYEAGAELIPEWVAKFSLEHPRCGTAFLLTLVLFSILVFTALGPLPILWRLISRILLIPVLAGLARAYIRWTANHLKNHSFVGLSGPTLPCNLSQPRAKSSMLEVAIKSFKSMRQAEQEFIA